MMGTLAQYANSPAHRLVDLMAEAGIEVIELDELLRSEDPALQEPRKAAEQTIEQGARELRKVIDRDVLQAVYGRKAHG